jgi:hypothetical protein
MTRLGHARGFTELRSGVELGGRLRRQLYKRKMERVKGIEPSS